MLNSTATPLSGPLSGPPHFVDLHVNPGESVSIQLFDGNETILRGPATITMISQHTFPPIPMPVQVPPGHMIQQIVDENGTLRHIILSALNNNGNSPSNTALMPQQQQQQQPFPYCCCCCYSCTGTAPTAPLPPPPPPPPPPQLHHNILAFPTQPSRRRLPNRTFSPAGKRAPPTFYNNNTLGKSPVRNKIGSTAAASVDGVSKVSYANGKHTTASDNKPYELNSNRVLVGKVNHNENCLSDTTKHVLNNTCINKESIDHSISKTIIETDGSILTQTRTTPPLPPFSYTSLEEQKDSSLTSDKNNCSHFDKSNNSPILLEINLSSDPRNQQFIEEEEEEIENETVKDSEVPQNNLLNSKIDDQIIETSRVKDSSDDNEVSLLCEESLEAEFEHHLKGVDLPEEDEQINEQNYNNSNTTSDSQSNSCISSQVQDNQNDDNCMAEQNSDDKWTVKLKGEQSLNTSLTLSQNTSQQLNKQLIDRSDSINSEKSEHIIQDTDISIQRSFDEFQKIESITNSNNNSNSSKKLGEEEIEGQALNEELGKGVKSSPQRSPKHLLPQLELLNLTYTSLTANTVKLKWTYSQPHSLQDQLYAKHYVVEMLLNKSSTDNISQNCRIVYQGHSNNCRISHLSSQQQYSFRVRTTSEEHLVVSNILTITTPEQQPISNKYNKKSKQQLLQQQIQQQQHQIHQQQILLQQQQQLQEQQSRVNDSDEPAITSDQRCAILILLLFTLFALIVAVLIQHLLTD